MMISINTFPSTIPNSAKGLLTFSEQVWRGQGDGSIVAVTSLYTLLIKKSTKFCWLVGWLVSFCCCCFLFGVFFYSVSHFALNGEFVFQILDYIDLLHIFNFSHMTAQFYSLEINVAEWVVRARYLVCTDILSIKLFLCKVDVNTLFKTQIPKVLRVV